MDEDLIRILANPFGEGSGEKGTRRQRRGGGYESFQAEDLDRGSDDLTVFRYPLPQILDIHNRSVSTVMEHFFSPLHPNQVRQVLQEDGERLRLLLEEIKENFRSQIEHCHLEQLEKEAIHIERRTFKQVGAEQQVAFLQLKRYYERFRTFQSVAEVNWEEVMRLLDKFLVTPETRQLARTVQSEMGDSVDILLKKSTIFLNNMRDYLQVDHEELDPISGSFQAQIEYDAEVNYSLAEVLGIRDNQIVLASSSSATISGSDLAAAAASKYGGSYGALLSTGAGVSGEGEEFDTANSSLATNIVIETKERLLNRATIFASPVIGSMDWNRRRDYYLEVALRDYEQALEHFRRAFHVNLSEETIKNNMTMAAALSRRGSGVQFLERYLILIQSSLNKIAEEISGDDYPGVENPEIFLYHCGPFVLLNILMQDLRQRGIGEMFYLDEQSTNVREFPMALIQRELIAWQEKRFRDLHRDEVDSYLVYSRALDMVRKDYRILCDEGLVMRRKEQPGGSYATADRWLRENRLRVFGVRKSEIFRRFIRNSVLEPGRR